MSGRSSGVVGIFSTTEPIAWPSIPETEIPETHPLMQGRIQGLRARGNDLWFTVAQSTTLCENARVNRSRFRFAFLLAAGLSVFAGMSHAGAQTQYPITPPPSSVPSLSVPPSSAPASSVPPTSVSPSSAPASSAPASVLPTATAVADPAPAPAAVLGANFSQPAFTGSNATAPLTAAGAALIGAGVAFVLVGRRRRRRAA